MSRIWDQLWLNGTTARRVCSKILRCAGCGHGTHTDALSEQGLCKRCQNTHGYKAKPNKLKPKPATLP